MPCRWFSRLANEVVKPFSPALNCVLSAISGIRIWLGQEVTESRVVWCLIVKNNKHNNTRHEFSPGTGASSYSLLSLNKWLSFDLRLLYFWKSAHRWQHARAGCHGNGENCTADSKAVWKGIAVLRRILSCTKSSYHHHCHLLWAASVLSQWRENKVYSIISVWCIWIFIVPILRNENQIIYEIYLRFRRENCSVLGLDKLI